MPDVLMPVSHARSEVHARLQLLDLSTTCAHFCHYVTDREGRFNDHFAYEPKYLDEVLTAWKPEGKSLSKADREALRIQVGHVETAMAYCIRAAASREKPLLALLEAVQAHCSLFDREYAAAEEKARRRKEAPRQGGYACQANRHPAKIEATRLLKAKAPPGGWKSPKDAIEAILEELTAFIRRERISLVCGANLKRTVRGWLDSVPLVAAAYRHIP